MLEKVLQKVDDSDEELSEQQIQALVDYAEKQAREKRKEQQDILFESSQW